MIHFLSGHFGRSGESFSSLDLKIEGRNSSLLWVSEYTFQSLLSLILLGPQELFGRNALHSFPPNRPPLIVFQSRTKNLSPCSSAVIVKRRWNGTKRSPVPANVYPQIAIVCFDD